jgi:serine/threonine-protein kinase
MGEVVAARHVRLDRNVAIKRLPDSFAEKEQVRERFAEEGRLLASLAHPHIVPVYDYVEDEGLCLLVMEALPNGTLWDRQTAEGLTMPSSCVAVLAACSGLSYAHDHQVLHRDVKPENLMFDGEQTLKVTDFGIAKVFGGDQTLATVEGEVIGTPAYMAPEQAAGKVVGPLADVYALATVLYELLSGTLPFEVGDDQREFLASRVNDEPRPLSEVAPHVPESLQEATMEGLARRPEDRPQSAEEFGVAVGNAATAAWGTDWTDASDVRLMAEGAITRATQTTTLAPGSRVQAPASEKVRAELAAHQEGAALSGLDVEDLVPLHELLKPPPVPVLALAATAVFGLVLLAVSVFGLGSVTRDNTLAPGQVTLDGEDISSGTAELDLADRITVAVTELPDGAETADSVEIRLSAAGVPLGASTAGSVDEAEAGGTEIGAKSLRVLSGGTMTGELRFLDDDGGGLVDSQEFALRTDQPWYLTAAAFTGLIILLFVIAFGASVAQLLLLAWSAGAGEPTVAAIVVAMGSGALMGGTGSWALYRIRRRARLRDRADIEPIEELDLRDSEHPDPDEADLVRSTS